MMVLHSQERSAADRRRQEEGRRSAVGFRPFLPMSVLRYDGRPIKSWHMVYAFIAVSLFVFALNRVLVIVKG